MVKVSSALFKIEQIKKLEDKTQEIKSAITTADPKDRNTMTLEAAGIDANYILEIYVQLHSIREFYQKDLENQEVDCDWT